MYDFVESGTCNLKFSVFTNQDGNILQEGETAVGEKNFSFSGFISTITAAEAVNDDESPALHNGVCGLIWLFTGIDNNFDPLSVKKTSVEMIDNE